MSAPVSPHSAQGFEKLQAEALYRIETVGHDGFRVPDPFAPRERPGASFFSALLATALFRCWHLLIFFAGWATMVATISHHGHSLAVDPSLLTVIGTVIGFVVSYRTTSSFERYNEGRRLWSQIILASRTFARTVWFHIPDPPAGESGSADEMKARFMIEKKTAINLLEAYGVALKHYLRGEDGIYYSDLYHLVKFLPAYALPHGMPHVDLANQDPNKTVLSPTSPQDSSMGISSSHASNVQRPESQISHRAPEIPVSPSHLPFPATTPKRQTKFSVTSPSRSDAFPSISGIQGKAILPKSDEKFLFPASTPPKYHLFDLFPFSLLVKMLTKSGKEVKGKKAARLRARLRNNAVSHNLPLEISFYLSSYISELQRTKAIDVPTTNNLLGALNQLVDGLTGLERILTTPIPFSYSIHLWTVTIIYCLSLPFQIWIKFKWLTIPATVILSFIYFGFLVAGEEIENPFGYDKNDLNLDHFTRNIIRNELHAITSTAAPDPARWVFSPENNLIFAHNVDEDERLAPDEWVKRGHVQMQKAMAIV